MSEDDAPAPNMTTASMAAANKMVPSKADVMALAGVVDHLVEATRDASASLRRACILLDIDANSGTSLGAVGERLGLEKSVVSRNVDALWDVGAVLRGQGVVDGREIRLETSNFAHKHVQMAVRPFGNHHFVLIKSLYVFIDLFDRHMPSLRELKALLSVGAKGQAGRADIINNLYDGPPTTDQRAIRHLIDEGIFEYVGKTKP